MSGTSGPSTLLTKDQIVAECVKHGYFRTPSCNEKLYLHHKGFDGVEPEALKEFTDAKVIWLEGNVFQNIDPEEFSSQWPVTRQLYLHNNMLSSCDWAGQFQRLGNLNISDNYVTELRFGIPGKEYVAPESGVVSSSPSKSDALAKAADQNSDATKMSDDDFVAMLDAFQAQCAALDETVKAEQSPKQGSGDSSKTEGDEPSPAAETATAADADAAARGLDNSLTMLQAKNNVLATPEAIIELLALKELNTLDLSGNKLEDGERILKILERLPNLKSLYLSGNPCVRGISSYRKTVLSRCKSLKHLDDRPVFEDERRTVTAWATGGLDAERKEKKKMKEEEDARQQQRLEDFRQLVRDARRERRREEHGPDAGSSSSSGSDESSCSSSDTDPDVVEGEAQGHTEFYRRNYQGQPNYTGPITDGNREQQEQQRVLSSNSGKSNRRKIEIVEDDEDEEEEAAPAVAAAGAKQREHVDPMADVAPSAAPAASSSSSSSPTARPSSSSQRSNGKYDKLWQMASSMPDAAEDDDDDGDVWVPPAAKSAQ